MLKHIVRYVLIGHSERRQLFQETNRQIQEKIKLALEAGLIPVLCVGERRRPADQWLHDPTELTREQVLGPLEELREAFEGLTKPQIKKIVIAYEPVWAISSEKEAQPATGHYANAVARLLREKVSHALGEEATDLSILYGGSVDVDNAVEFTHQRHLNGLLIGQASLHARTFLAICKSVI